MVKILWMFLMSITTRFGNIVSFPAFRVIMVIFLFSNTITVIADV
jgi:hypothetical protein